VRQFVGGHVAVVALCTPSVYLHCFKKVLDNCCLAQSEQWCKCVKIEYEISAKAATPKPFAVTRINIHAGIVNGNWMLRRYHSLKNTAMVEPDVCDSTYKSKSVDTMNQHDIILVVLGTEALLDPFCDVEQNIMLSYHQMQISAASNANLNCDTNWARSGLGRDGPEL
jgi:hypothetical protein